jgi:predicted nucleic acid-binding protein
VSVLLDVNMLLACGWQSHTQHPAAVGWLDGVARFYTCALVELGFLRVSMGPGFRASFDDAMRALEDLKGRANAGILMDDFDVSKLPILVSHTEVTDAYLVSLANSQGLRLATLDDALCTKSWAATTAFNPLAQQPTP